MSSVKDKLVTAESVAVLHAYAEQTYMKKDGSTEFVDAYARQEIENLKYVPIEITSFTNNVGILEIGRMMDVATLTWELNKTPTALTLDDEELELDVTTKELSGLRLIEDKTWTLKATDEKGAISEKTTSITFLNGVYFGVDIIPAEYNSEFILTLEKVLSKTKARTITVTAGEGQYIYYCIPTSYGDCNFNVGGFDGGFSKVATFDFTNYHGHVESYDVYKSTNANLGKTTVKIS